MAGDGYDANGKSHAIIQKSGDGGVTWSTPDDFSSVGMSMYMGIGSDALGNLYAVGSALNGSIPGSSWLIRQSLDGGITWNSVDAPLSGQAQGVAMDSAGNAFVVGHGTIPGVTTNTWLVRKGSSNGSVWSNADYLTTGEAFAVFSHPSAGVLVAGQTTYTVKNGSYFAWTVRRSLDRGATWITVDNALAGQARGIGADASGNIYVIGSSGNHWIVRNSTNGGTSWTTVDDFLGCVTVTNSTKPFKTSTQCAIYASAYGFATDSNGSLFVAGVMQKSSSYGAYEWIVRGNLGGNAAWQTVDTFQYVPNYNAFAYAIAADTLGNVYVTGRADDSSGTAHWIVRKH